MSGAFRAPVQKMVTFSKLLHCLKNTRTKNLKCLLGDYESFYIKL